MSEEWPLDDSEVDYSKVDCSNLQELIEHANIGDPFAQNLLGAMLATGSCFELDIPGGLYWYCEAIKGGYVEAKWNAGSMLVDGEDGAAKQRDLGMRLIEEAADANNNSACLFIAQCYRSGTYGKPVANDRSSYWEKRAWDYKNAREFDKPLDVFQEYSLKLQPPIVKFRST